MAEMRWTPAMVEDRLIEAADVMRRLPEERVQGFISSWPQIVREYWESFGWTEPVLRRAWPAPAAITRMDETLAWLRWLDPDDGKLLWARAEGKPWKAICWRFGMSRATAHRRWQYGVSLIAWRLNGRRVPTRRSRQSLVERAHAMSS